MRYKTYYRLNQTTNEVEQLEFLPEHFLQAGFKMFASMAGMPLLEAYQLVNNWNRIVATIHPSSARFIYFLD